MKYSYKYVNHSAGEYAKEESFENREEGYKTYKIYTNKIEGF